MGRVNFKDIRREDRQFAGLTVPVAVAPRFKKHGAFVWGVKSLIDGMAVTLNYLVHPSKVVTRQYPENRATLRFPERYRAMLRMIHDENGYHRCTACRMCERACPNSSITIVTRGGGELYKTALDRHIWRMDTCIFCNACVQVCPFGALEMTHDFENAVYDRRLLVFTLNRYAGPPGSVLLKQSDPALRQKMMEPQDRYGGPVPMAGHALPTVRPLRVPAAESSPAQTPRDTPLARPPTSEGQA
jgi:NADH-quinone oxidoreductase subunit I